MIKTVTVTVRDVEFEVTGEFTPHKPAKITSDPYNSEPAEGGTFETENIQVYGIDMENLLSPAVLQEIREEAEAEANK